MSIQDSGAYMEHRFAGPRSVTILGLNTGTLDISKNGWGHQVELLIMTSPFKPNHNTVNEIDQVYSNSCRLV